MSPPSAQSQVDETQEIKSLSIEDSSSKVSPSLQASGLFRVDGLVVVITGGGTGAFLHSKARSGQKGR